MARAKWTPDQEAEIRALRAEIVALKARPPVVSLPQNAVVGLAERDIARFKIS